VVGRTLCYRPIICLFTSWSVFLEVGVGYRAHTVRASQHAHSCTRITFHFHSALCGPPPVATSRQTATLHRGKIGHCSAVRLHVLPSSNCNTADAWTCEREVTRKFTRSSIVSNYSSCSFSARCEITNMATVGTFFWGGGSVGGYLSVGQSCSWSISVEHLQLAYGQITNILMHCVCCTVVLKIEQL